VGHIRRQADTGSIPVFATKKSKGSIEPFLILNEFLFSVNLLMNLIISSILTHVCDNQFILNDHIQ